MTMNHSFAKRMTESVQEDRMKQITPAQEAELKHLKRMVDNNEQAGNRVDAAPDAWNNLHQARRELKDFVSKLRREGYLI